MANLQQIMAETSKSYDNSRKALQNQINAISGDLKAEQGRINAQYAQQSKNLDNQRNWQAQASSMSASRNGGSFGGSSEIANKKYYQQAYVPAVTQMQTNQANDLSSAASQANKNKLSLQQTLASLNDEASRYGMQRYDAAVQAEREEARWREQQAAEERRFREQMAQQNAYTKYLMSQRPAGVPTSSAKGKAWDFGNGYSVRTNRDGSASYYRNGNAISAGEFLSSANNKKAGNWKLWNDIWNNGVSTRGVGSDTVNIFRATRSGSNKYNNKLANNELAYLWRM